MNTWRLLVNKSVHAPTPSTFLPVSPLADEPPDSVLTGGTRMLNLPHLWVEKGAIWQLPNLLVGFTGYSGVKSLFQSFAGSDIEPAPASWYRGLPYSEKDFPILCQKYIYHQVTKKSYVYDWYAERFLIWSTFHMLKSITMFLSMLPMPKYYAMHGHKKSAGPILPVADLRRFSADSPSGKRTFEGEYVLYAPGGIPNGLHLGGNGIAHDIEKYSWNCYGYDDGPLWGPSTHALR